MGIGKILFYYSLRELVLYIYIQMISNHLFSLTIDNELIYIYIYFHYYIETIIELIAIIHL